MKDVRFYLDFPDKATKKKSGKKHAGHIGNVVAIFPENRFMSGSVAVVEAIGALFHYPDSHVASTSVSWDYLRDHCKRIPETTAREIHPRLFARLDG